MREPRTEKKLAIGPTERHDWAEKIERIEWTSVKRGRLGWRSRQELIAEQMRVQRAGSRSSLKPERH